MKKILILTLVMTAILLAGCAAADASEVEVDEGSYEFVDVSVLAAMIEERPDSFLLVNTHIPFEGNLPATDYSVPYNEIGENVDQFPEGKDAEIVLYCRSDRMARIAADVLVAEGYTNLKVLTGGMVAWQNAGLTLEMTP